jgi:hypothetical protein
MSPGKFVPVKATPFYPTVDLLLSLTTESHHPDDRTTTPTNPDLPAKCYNRPQRKHYPAVPHHVLLPPVRSILSQTTVAFTNWRQQSLWLWRPNRPLRMGTRWYAYHEPELPGDRARTATCDSCPEARPERTQNFAHIQLIKWRSVSSRQPRVRRQT